MDRIKIKYIIDIGMLASFIVSAFTGIMLYFTPGGLYKGGQIEYFGIIKQTWGAWHTYSSFLLLFFVILHLMLNWKWLTCMTKSFLKKDKKKCD